MVEEALKEFGKFIKERRLECGMTQSDVAEKANVTMRTIFNIESGQSVSLRTLIPVLRILDLQLTIYEND